MAMNLLDQLLNLAGLKLPEAKDRYDPSVYRQEVAKQDVISPTSAATETARAKKTSAKGKAGEELTGVAKYMAKKQQQEQPEPVEEVQETATEAKEPGLTGVAKYLAKLDREAQERAEAEAAAFANMSSVERYLARLEGKKIPVTTAKAKAPEKNETEKKPLTRVERYLSEQAGAAPTKTATSAAKPASKEPKPAAPAVAKAEKPVVAAKPAAPAKPAEEKKSKAAAPVNKESVSKAAPAGKLVDLTAKVVQCHAVTSRGVQCKNKTGLVSIEKTIDKQKYRFFACKLHDTDSFKPFPDLL